MTQQTRTLFDEAPYQKNFTARVLSISELGVALEQTLFYPTGGGQPGDQGHLLLPDGSEAKVLGTQRDPLLRALIWHQLEKPETLHAVQEVQGCIDWERRYQHMRMHTCLHLLCSILKAPVTGCSIGAEKGRLDFDLPELTLDKEQITHSLNELIDAALDVWAHELPVCECQHLFELSRIRIPSPMNQSTVRVIDIPGVDIQPCGGTHVRNTREIGPVVCDRIEKKSRQNRRVTLRFA